MHDTHVGESAELYALGMLSEPERAEVEAHLAHCADCRRFVGKAEETVLALESVAKPVDTPFELDRRMRFAAPVKTLPNVWLAVAAAFVLGFLPSAGLLIEHAQPSPVRDVAVVAMIRSHFAHTQFVGNASAPRAKAIYAPDGSWIYVIVEGRHTYELDAVNGSRMQPLGMTQPQGSTSEIFLRPSPAPRITALVLRDGNSVVARARLRQP